MQRITYHDTVMHYHIKLSEIVEAIDSIQKQLITQTKEMEMAWTGENAELFREKLQTVRRRYDRSAQDLLEVQQILKKLLTEIELTGN